MLDRARHARGFDPLGRGRSRRYRRLAFEMRLFKGPAKTRQRAVFAGRPSLTLAAPEIPRPSVLPCPLRVLKTMAMRGVARMNRGFLQWLLCGVALGTLGACDRPEPKEQEAKEENKPVTEQPVVVAQLASRPMKLEIKNAATIEALRMVKLSAEATGIVQDLRVQEGDSVKAGQRLARIKQEAQSASVRRAQTNLAQAKRELARISALAKKGVVGRQELDQAKDRVDLAQMDIRDRGRDLANTKVTTPIKGVVTQRAVQAGDFVGAGATLLEITDFSTLVARVYVAERELDRIAVGQPVQVEGKAALGRKAKGRILRIAPTVDAATGTVKVTVALPPQSLNKATDFRPGMYAEVTIKISERQGVLALPKSAVSYENGNASVMLAQEGVAKRVSVTLGQRDGDWVELRGGIQAQDQVIVAGQQNLKDGAKIKVVPPNTDGIAKAPDKGSAKSPAQAKDQGAL